MSHSNFVIRGKSTTQVISNLLLNPICTCMWTCMSRGKCKIMLTSFTGHKHQVSPSYYLPFILYFTRSFIFLFSQMAYSCFLSSDLPTVSYPWSCPQLMILLLMSLKKNWSNQKRACIDSFCHTYPTTNISNFCTLYSHLLLSTFLKSVPLLCIIFYFFMHP